MSGSISVAPSAATSRPAPTRARTSPIGFLAPSRPSTPTGDVVLRAEGITRRFGHVWALRGAALEVRRGEVIGLVGDNGAGKSTFVKAITGNLKPDSGVIEINGRPTQIGNPAEARDLGIEVVHQDLALAGDLSAVANLFLGRERLAPSRRWLNDLDRTRMRREAKTLFELADIRLPSLSTPVRSLSGGQRQIIAVLRALAFAQNLVFMDEPTAALGVTQTARVTELIRLAASEGVAVVLISHNLPELLDVADRVVVLRHGRSVETFDSATVTGTELIASMTGLSA